MSETKKSKSAWEILQSSILLLTPVLIAVMGYFFNKSLTELESQIANVSAMQPFMEMIADSNTTKSKMGAYAIYMLKKDDPEIAAQIIMAPAQSHLTEVLQDIGRRDTVVYAVLQRTISASSAIDDSLLTDKDRYLLDVMDKIDQAKYSDENVSMETDEPDGWLYLGVRNEKLIVGVAPTLDNYLNTEFTLTKATNLRQGNPQPPNYRLPKLIRVINEGTSFKVKTLDEDKKGHVWVEVIIQ
ncbi:MAG: hypothetical protein HKM92_00425 [Arenibacter sp.]|nr:hypothetical protein [Muriicola sp.]NNG08604.1 hypothetical protein [Arenibacter sp.]